MKKSALWIAIVAVVLIILAWWYAVAQSPESDLGQQAPAGDETPIPVEPDGGTGATPGADVSGGAVIN